MDSQNRSSISSNQDNVSLQGLMWQRLFGLLLFAGLLLIGFIIELGPKWPSSFIHIPLSPGHGFTTQDATALIPVSLALILLVSSVWKYRPTMKRRIQDAPINAFGVALIIGLSVGLVLGIGLGILFKVSFVVFLKDVLEPIQTLFYG